MTSNENPQETPPDHGRSRGRGRAGAAPNGQGPRRTRLARARAAKRRELKDGLLRSLAEMENLRRRTEREVADARSYAVTEFARDMLSVADNMRRALDSVPRRRAGERRGSLDGPDRRNRAHGTRAGEDARAPWSEGRIRRARNSIPIGTRRCSRRPPRSSPAPRAGGAARLRHRRARAAACPGRRRQGRPEGGGQPGRRRLTGPAARPGVPIASPHAPRPEDATWPHRAPIFQPVSRGTSGWVERPRDAVARPCRAQWRGRARRPDRPPVRRRAPTRRAAPWRSRR